MVEPEDRIERRDILVGHRIADRHVAAVMGRDREILIAVDAVMAEPGLLERGGGVPEEEKIIELVEKLYRKSK